MDFARKQMKKMGWSEGKGLGLAENGITKPLKPTVQMDTRGLGLTIEDTIQVKNQWWSEAYNVANQGLKAKYKITSIGVVVHATEKQSQLLSEKRSKNKKSTLYNNHFISAGTLHNGRLHLDKTSEDELEEATEKTHKMSKKNKRRKYEESATNEKLINEKNENNSISQSSDKDQGQVKSKCIDFEQVFSHSKGSTCHKAARLGFKMNGKMKRIQEQELEFLKKVTTS